MSSHDVVSAVKSVISSRSYKKYMSLLVIRNFLFLKKEYLHGL